MGELTKTFHRGQQVFVLGVDGNNTDIASARYHSKDEKHGHHLVEIDGEKGAARRIRDEENISKCRNGLAITHKILG